MKVVRQPKWWPRVSIKTLFVLLFAGVLVSVIMQIVGMLYLVEKRISIRQVVPWYYHLGAILGTLYVWFCATAMLEENKAMKKALGLIGISASLVFLNIWLFITSPALLIMGAIFISVLLAIAWRLFRQVKANK